MRRTLSPQPASRRLTALAGPLRRRRAAVAVAVAVATVVTPLALLDAVTDADGVVDAVEVGDCGAGDAVVDASVTVRWTANTSWDTPSEDSARPTREPVVTVSRNDDVAVEVTARYALANDAVSAPPPELPTSTYTAPEYGDRAGDLMYGPDVDVDWAKDGEYDAVVAVEKLVSRMDRWYDSDCPVMTMSTPYVSWQGCT